ncbi:MAG: tRNA (N6-threonylcarbamoyladenosine(37)-N6)-methyltransferase TrmO [Dehalococcoidales bacterium]|nr:tRNA (N6-threonylcarbamoyladenosine(37)-N6)-methyltransferase TrmO [Dehalococcoidales bacterium]
MAAPEEVLVIKPIGVVRSAVKEPTREKHPDLISEIVIDEALAEGLDDITDFSHIIVLWWIHRSRRPAPLKVHPRGNPEHKLMGVFATRSPDRPNPIGKTTVKLIERRRNILRVQGLDAIDGTPVIDIKPYIPGYDSAEGATAPPWVIKG